MQLSQSERRRYARHLALAEIGVEGQQRLKQARVLIVGAGGLGCPAALYLAAAGVGTLGIVDFDRVEESNLQRQVLFTTDDVGKPKAAAAGARLRALNPTLQIASHCVELSAANVHEVLAPYDLVVDGSDRIGTRYLVNDTCVILRKTLVAAAIHRFEGQALTVVPGRGPCYRCLFPALVDGLVPSCAEAGVLGVLPGVLGTLQATEVIKLITGIGTPLIGRLLTYDALTLEFKEFQGRRRADCAVCGDHPSITTPTDPPGFCTLEELERAPSIDAAELARQLRERPPRIIDVREPEEFVRGHIAGSVNVPLALFEQGAPQQIEALVARTASDSALPLVFVCLSGVRSRRACAIAQRHGVVLARQLVGGLRAWREAVQPSLAL